MRLEIEPGTYVAAVSGGVDSIVLLDILAKKPGLKLIVAHFDHGIRSDSYKDREFVQEKAGEYGLPFVFEEGKLGPGTSEAAARDARYGFLKKVVKASGASHIATAHHQDDLIETAVINMLRGTGRRGLSSLKNQKDILRPLLRATKDQLRSYAKDNHLKWREDPTNQDTTLLRNYVRHIIVPKLSAAQRRELLAHIEKLSELNPMIERVLEHEMKIDSEGRLDRSWFIALPQDVASEAMVTWLRQNDINEFDKKNIDKLVIAGKTLASGKRTDADSKTWLVIKNNTLALAPKER